MEFSEITAANLKKYLGADAGKFLSKAGSLIKKYSEIWRITKCDYVRTETINLLYDCYSLKYGRCVMKICIPGPEVLTEINCIRAYDGRGYVKLWDCGPEDDVMLLEYVTPGDQMWAVKDYRERARLMAERVNGLPIEWDGCGDYPTYGSWMVKLLGFLKTLEGAEEAVFYLGEAIFVYDGLKRKYNRACLLHGDLHQENMLLNRDGGYTIIDPKGVVDDPVMETARFLNNETPCETEKLIEIAKIMSPVTSVPAGDILRSMYVDSALGNCWTFEEYYDSAGALDKARRDALSNIKFVYELININQ